MSANPKVWFITGSSSGFGRHMAEYALNNGDKVVATLRKPEVLAPLAAQYSPDQLLVLKLDVTQPQEILDAFAAAGKHFGRIDVVFNNAGFGMVGDAEGMVAEVARSLFDVNFWGAVDVSKEAIRFFREENKPAGGRLLQNSSLLGLVGSACISTYCGAKHALEGFSESLAAELNPDGNIKLTIIEPGWFRTEVVGSNLVCSSPHPAYETPGSPAAAAYKYFNSKPLVRGDVSKAVKVIYKFASSSENPLHFPLGLDCVETMRSQSHKMLAIADQYESWSVGLDAE